MPFKVLLADDSMTAQNMGKKILTEAGYEVVTVSNGAQALKKLASEKPDVVILDVFMPGYTGLEVCERIKNSPETASMPVVLCVAKMEPFRAEDSTRVKADAVIIKPFEATDLIARMQQLEDKVSRWRACQRGTEENRATAERQELPELVEPMPQQKLGMSRVDVPKEMAAAPAIGMDLVTESASNSPTATPAAEFPLAPPLHFEAAPALAAAISSGTEAGAKAATDSSSFSSPMSKQPEFEIEHEREPVEFVRDTRMKSAAGYSNVFELEEPTSPKPPVKVFDVLGHEPQEPLKASDVRSMAAMGAVEPKPEFVVERVSMQFRSDQPDVTEGDSAPPQSEESVPDSADELAPGSTEEIAEPSKPVYIPENYWPASTMYDASQLGTVSVSIDPEPATESEALIDLEPHQEQAVHGRESLADEAMPDAVPPPEESSPTAQAMQEKNLRSAPPGEWAAEEVPLENGERSVSLESEMEAVIREAEPAEDAAKEIPGEAPGTGQDGFGARSAQRTDAETPEILKAHSLQHFEADDARRGFPATAEPHAFEVEASEEEVAPLYRPYELPRTIPQLRPEQGEEVTSASDRSTGDGMWPRTSGFASQPGVGDKPKSSASPVSGSETSPEISSLRPSIAAPSDLAAAENPHVLPAPIPPFGYFAGPHSESEINDEPAIEAELPASGELEGSSPTAPMSALESRAFERPAISSEQLGQAIAATADSPASEQTGAGEPEAVERVVNRIMDQLKGALIEQIKREMGKK